MSIKKTNISSQLSSIQNIEKKLNAKKALLVDYALTKSQNPNDLMKANEVLNVESRKNDNPRKTFVVDPLEFNSFMGYKDKPFNLSYGIIRRMSYSVPIIRSIIGTRIDQIASFCEPQQSKYSTGFVVRKKQGYFSQNNDKVTKEDEHTIEKITEFLLNCGVNNKFEGDDFDSFTRKIMNDSLSFDQMCFEIVHDRKGRPIEFYATDASTIRTTSSFDTESYKQENYREREKVSGYYPSHCQIYNSSIVSEFYPWEMCMGVRNPSSSIYSNGYGVSEIEMLTNTITSMLWSDEYNRKFFSQGSAPKGFFKIKAGTTVNPQRITEFKQYWQSMMSSVTNSHKTPIFEGDIDWIDLQRNNRDMEFAKWQEYLIKLSTAIYRIDPSEINFAMSGSSDQKPMFEGNNEARLKHSKDKGLIPLLKFLERRINKYLISRINPNFEFIFVGVAEDTPQQELEADIKMMTNFMTVDEVRIKRGLKPLGADKGGDIVANSVVFQSIMQKQQAEQAAQQQDGGEEDDQQTQEQGYGDQEDDQEDDQEENPFEKSFESFINGLNEN